MSLKAVCMGLVVALMVGVTWLTIVNDQQPRFLDDTLPPPPVEATQNRRQPNTRSWVGQPKSVGYRRFQALAAPAAGRCIARGGRGLRSPRPMPAG